MGAESGAAGAKTYGIAFALSDAEIKLFTRLGQARRLKVARFGRYIGWINIAAGAGLSFSAGAIALRYYGMEPGPNASTLVMALFSFFLAGGYLYWWLVRIWYRQAYAPRVLRHKETVHVRLSGDGVTYSAKGWQTQAAWTAIEEATFSGGTAVLWIDADSAVMIPLRAISPPEERSLFAEAVRSWMKSAAAKKARPQ